VSKDPKPSWTFRLVSFCALSQILASFFESKTCLRRFPLTIPALLGTDRPEMVEFSRRDFKAIAVILTLSIAAFLTP
jgi:hypothetical protein